MPASPTIILARGRFGSPSSQIIEQTRAWGPVSREELGRRTGLSTATVSRAVGSLLLAGLLRERPDRIPEGVNGRPGMPVEVDHTRFGTLGFHLGRGLDTVALGDLRGLVVAQTSLVRPVEAPPDLDDLAEAAARLLARSPGRAPLSAGLVAPWSDLGLNGEGVAAALHERLGLDVVTADHVAGVAATEFLHRRSGSPGVTTYLYARNTVGLAVAESRGARTEVSRVGSLTHFPCGSGSRCSCGRTGCLAATASDHSLVDHAVEQGILRRGQQMEDLLAAARRGDARGHELFAERARTLGRVAAIVRDITTPDRMVLVGQGFTGYPAVLAEVQSAFTEHTALGEIDLTFTRFGGGVQAVTACTVALGPIYDDPLGVVPAPRPSFSRSNGAVGAGPT